MVSLWQALKVTLIFLIFGFIPFFITVITIISLINIGLLFDFNQVYISNEFEPGVALGLLGLLIVGSLLFFIGLFKAIGDITEASLLE
ncbi:MAG: hypothetical protein ACTSQE_09220 [Candidatus Heimdallarchaeaceae archaeon]